MRVMSNGIRVVIAIAAMAAAAPLAAAEQRDPVREAARRLVAERVDRDRAAHGLPPLQPAPELVSDLDEWCRRQIREKTVGHFSLDGAPPYARYSAIGNADAILENAVAWSANYPFRGPAVLDLARRSQDAMMGEQPPNDSHRRAILDPHATHLAVGLAWEGNEFRMVQLILRRRVDWISLPRAEAREGERISISGATRDGWEVAAATLHWQDLPRPLTPAAANRIESYDLPTAHRRIQAQPAGGRPTDQRGALARFAHALRAEGGQLSVTAGGGFSLRSSYDRGPGIYTVVLWLREPRTGELVASSHISTTVLPDVPSPAAAGGR